MDRLIKKNAKELKRSNKVNNTMENRQQVDGNKNKRVKSMEPAIKHAAEGGCAKSDKLSKFKFGLNLLAKTPTLSHSKLDFERENYVSNQLTIPDEYEETDDNAPIPKWHPLSCSPWPYVTLNAKDTALTSYIFMCDDQHQYGDEMLIKTKFGVVGTRTNLKSLKPGCFVDKKVINVLCCKLTHEGNCVSRATSFYNWYLPTKFAHYAITKPTSQEEVMDLYQEDYMTKIDLTSKIFIPMKDDEGPHWYLMVVDVIRQHIHVLDSLPCEDRKPSRRRDVLKVAIFLEEMLLDNSFYTHVIELDSVKPIIHNYPIVECRGLPTESCGSNDCGVWVATWMQECSWKDEYNFTQVCQDARVKLALDLVHSSYNEVMDQIEEKAHEHFKTMTKIA